MALGYRPCQDSFRVLYASTAKLMEIIEDRQVLAFDNGYLADTRKRLVRRDRREDHRRCRHRPHRTPLAASRTLRRIDKGKKS